MEGVWSQALHQFENGYTYWFSQEDMKQLNQINEIYRQVPPEEEWLMKMYEPCEPTNPQAKFLMPSEILTKLNLRSGMKLSIRKLSAGMENLKYGNPISKRINGSPRKVYPVIERSDIDEDKYQQEIKKEFTPTTIENPF